MPIDYLSLFEGMSVTVKSDNDENSNDAVQAVAVGDRHSLSLPDISQKTLKDLKEISESIQREILCILDMLVIYPDSRDLRYILKNSLNNLSKLNEEYQKRYKEAIEKNEIFLSARQAGLYANRVIMDMIENYREITEEESKQIQKNQEQIKTVFCEEGMKTIEYLSDMLSILQENKETGFALERFGDNEGMCNIRSLTATEQIPNILIKIPLSGNACYRYFDTINDEPRSLDEMGLPKRYKEVRVTEINKEKYGDVIYIISSGNKDAFKQSFPDLTLPEINRIFEEYNEIQNNLAKTRKDDGLQPETKYGIYGKVKKTTEWTGGATEFCLALSNGTMKELKIIKGDITIQL